MKAKTTRGFHSVEHPETGETIIVEEPFETDRETFELLQAEYSGFVEVEDSAENTTEPPDELVCGVELEDGGRCRRSVEESDATCWQH